MIDLMYYLTNLLFFNIPLLYYYISLRSSITFCFSSEDLYLSLGISLSCLFVIDFDLFCCKFFEIFVILSTILLPIEILSASAVLWITLFEGILSESVSDFLAWSRS